MPSSRILAVVFAVSLSGPALAQTLNPSPTRTTPSRSWTGFANSPQHNGITRSSGQPLNQIHWSSPVDQNPQYSGSALLIHYGSPLATKRGMVVFPVKTGATGGFEVQGRKSTDGTLVWTTPTDYAWPLSYNWGPSMGATLTPQNQVAIPASGGTILLRSDADAAVASAPRLAFYGLASYLANQATYDANVVITTPITSDALGNLYFGFLVQGPTPTGLANGIARIAANGTGSWVSAATASGDGSIQKVTYNSAPALSHDGASLYVEVNDSPGSGFGFGYLLRLNSSTLALQSKVRLLDPSGSDSYLPDDGTASPCVGREGDVYIGVLENPFPWNNDRGWMLHFDGTLSSSELPGAFGWDNTPSIVPANAVPSYSGPSGYLLLTKYNNYAGIGGDGVNKIAVLDPNTAMVDPVTGVSVMDEVLTIAGVTPDPGWTGTYPNAVREWCINTAVVDPLRRSALVNSEDGSLYRWDFVTNTFTQSIVLTAGIGEAYTPTMVAADGTVFAINNATLFAVGR